MSGTESQGLVRSISLPMQQAAACTPALIFYKIKKPSGNFTVRKASIRAIPLTGEKKE